MTDSPALPEVYKQVLDEETLASLLRDLEELAGVYDVRQRRGMDAPPLGFEDIQATLGEGVGVQIRYVHEGLHWWDTLMPGPQGVTLVRIQQQ